MSETTTAQRRAGDAIDQGLRKMHLKAGFDVEVPADVDAYANYMRWGYLRYTTAASRTLGRRALYIAIATTLITILTPILLHHYGII